MIITIDAAGRLVIPKAVRDAAGILPGTPLEVSLRDGRVEIAPAPLAVEIRVVDGVAVAYTSESIPTLPAGVVAQTRDGLRDERG